MEITEIKKIGQGKRYSLKVDDVFEGVIESEILARYNLKTGQQIEQSLLTQLKNENGDYACFDRALSVLEKSSKSKKQIFDYLSGKGYPQASIQKAIEKLEEYGYLDDLAYAQEYVKFKSASEGEKKMRFALKNKGIDEETISRALESVDPQQQEEVCINLARKKLKNAQIDIKTKQKLFSYLAGRGFSFDIINRAISQILEEQ